MRLTAAALACATLAGIAAARGAGLEPPAQSAASAPAAADAEQGQPAVAADPDKVEVTVGRFTVEDAYPELAGESARLLDPLRGHPVAVGLIRAAAAKLEQAYIDHGHFLTSVSIPSQDVPDGGECLLHVTRGYIASIDADAIPRRQRARVLAIVAPLIGRKALTRAQFERAILIASELPTLNLRSSLRSDGTDGGVVLVLTGAYREFVGQFAADNSMPAADGRVSGTLTGNYNPAVRAVDQVFVALGAAMNANPLSADSPRRDFDGGFRSALGTSGTGLELRYTWSRTNPRGSAAASTSGNTVLDTDSTYDRLALRITYPLLKNRSANWLVDVGVDATSLRQDADSSAPSLFDDRLRVLRLGIAGDRTFGAGTQGTISVELSKGIHGFGSRGSGQATPDEPLSQSGASDVFTKWEGHASLHRELPRKFAADLQMRAQYVASRPVLAAEKFATGGPADLSAYDNANFSGDRGWAARAELQRTSALTFAQATAAQQAYLFAARAETVNLEPIAPEPRSAIGNAAGIGVRYSISRPDARQGPLDMSGELARQINPGSNGLADHWRVNYAVSMRF